MKMILCCFFSLFLINCIQDDKLVRKKIDYEDITVSWYFYSYITDNSPDIIEVKKGNDIVEIYKAEDVVTDIAIQNKTIVIKGYKINRGIVYTKKILPEVFGYPIKIDSTASYEEYLNVPLGKKELE